jgi:predicted transcriptional regulator of viral defense system
MPVHLTDSELTLLAHLDRKREKRITAAEANLIIGPDATRKLAAMANKGVLDRVGRGVYVPRPLRAMGRPWSISALVAVEQLLQQTPHYIGGLAALTIHRLTEQLYASTVDVFLSGRRYPRTLANAKVRFHSVDRNELAIGVVLVSVEEVDVRISDREKTVLDCLNHPTAFGGLARGVYTADLVLDKVKIGKLVNYALDLSPMSSLQRLGVLMERHGVSARQVQRIASRVRTTKNLPAMIPGRRTGRFNAKWRIFENDLTNADSDSSSA